MAPFSVPSVQAAPLDADNVWITCATPAWRLDSVCFLCALQSWADVLSPAVVSQGPTECALKPAYETVFFATIAVPVIISVTAMMILLIAVALRKDEPDAPPHRRGCRARLAASWKSRAPVAVLLFMLQLPVAYMSVVSTCISVFDCTQPIDGTSYLRGDLRFPCSGSAYTMIAFCAAAALLVVGLGFPLLIVWKLGWRRRGATLAKLQDPSFAAAWGFLYQGYHMMIVARLRHRS